MSEATVSEMLIECSEIGDLEGVKRAIEFGADVNHRDDEALIRAASNGDIDLINYLIEAGARPASADGAALTMAAWSAADLELVKRLVEVGCNQQIALDSALHLVERDMAARVADGSRDFPAIAEFLRSKGAKNNVDEEEGPRP